MFDRNGNTRIGVVVILMYVLIAVMAVVFFSCLFGSAAIFSMGAG